MSEKELAKYLGKYVSFTINENAFLPTTKSEEKDTSNYYEGILRTNDGILSHFSLDIYNEYTKRWESIAIRDYTIPYIENFKIKEN